jgi:uncharacterized iron-regulated protein
MRSFYTFLIALLFSFNTQAQGKPTYKLYKANGKKTAYKKMLKKLKEADIIMFGEHHDNPIVHWLQKEVTADISKNKRITMGFEMLEADNQKQINAYLKDTINQKALDTLARLWPNYKTDYKPLVDFAKKNKFEVIATNVPRRNARIVFKKGFEGLDSLSITEKSWIAPLPFPYDANLKSYVAMGKMEHMKYMPEKMKINMPKAQAIKDATMAHFILKNKKEGQQFIHYNGSYHSDDYEGIVWYLKKANPDLKIITITTETVENPKKFKEELKNKADFIIEVDKNMTRTH